MHEKRSGKVTFLLILFVLKIFPKGRSIPLRPALPWMTTCPLHLSRSSLENREEYMEKRAQITSLVLA